MGGGWGGGGGIGAREEKRGAGREEQIPASGGGRGAYTPACAWAYNCAHVYSRPPLRTGARSAPPRARLCACVRALMRASERACARARPPPTGWRCRRSGDPSSCAGDNENEKKSKEPIFWMNRSEFRCFHCLFGGPSSCGPRAAAGPARRGRGGIRARSCAPTSFAHVCALCRASGLSCR